MGTDYYSVCPVCMNGFKADKEQKKEIKQLLAQAPSNVHFTSAHGKLCGQKDL